MKSKIKLAFLALSGAGLLADPAMGAVSLESGSLVAAFYQVIGGVVQNNTYTVDLGQASIYRENTAIGVSVSTIAGGPASSNIAADLVTAFGANWASDGTVRWLVVGNVGQTDPTVGGDPARTNYYSQAVSAIPATGVSTTLPTPFVSNSNSGTLSNNIEPFLDGVSNATQTLAGGITAANAAGIFTQKGAVNNIDDFVPPFVLTYFGIGINPAQVLGAGSITNDSGVDVGPVEGALDIYRSLHTTTGADLTAGLSGGDAAIRQGQYIGTLVLTSDGNLSMIPEPSSALLGLAGAVGLCLRRRRNA